MRPMLKGTLVVAAAVLLTANAMTFVIVRLPEVRHDATLGSMIAAGMFAILVALGALLAGRRK